MKYIDHARFWLWDRLGSLVDLIHPGYIAAEVTPRRVQRFYDVIHDVKEPGEEEMIQTPQGPVDTSDLADQVGEEPDEEEVAEKAKEIRNAFMEEGRLMELADIVLEVPFYQDPADAPLSAVTRATTVFIIGYTRHIIALTGMRDDTT